MSVRPTTLFTTTTTSCDNTNLTLDDENHDELSVEISPIEGYSEVKLIASPYGKSENKLKNKLLSPIGCGDDFDPLTAPTNESAEPGKLSFNRNGSGDSTGDSEINSPLNFTNADNLDLRSPANCSNIHNIINNSNSNCSNTNNVIPQWKRDLIQRRKQNIARTIGANQSVTTTAALTSSPTNNIKKGLNESANSPIIIVDLRKSVNEKSIINENSTSCINSPSPSAVTPVLSEKLNSVKSEDNDNTTTTSIVNSSIINQNNSSQEEEQQQKLQLQQQEQVTTASLRSTEPDVNLVKMPVSNNEEKQQQDDYDHKKSVAAAARGQYTCTSDNSLNSATTVIPPIPKQRKNLNNKSTNKSNENINLNSIKLDTSLQTKEKHSIILKSKIEGNDLIESYDGSEPQNLNVDLLEGNIKLQVSELDKQQVNVTNKKLNATNDLSPTSSDHFKKENQQQQKQQKIVESTISATNNISLEEKNQFKLNHGINNNIDFGSVNQSNAILTDHNCTTTTTTTTSTSNSNSFLRKSCGTGFIKNPSANKQTSSAVINKYLKQSSSSNNLKSNKNFKMVAATQELIIPDGQLPSTPTSSQPLNSDEDDVYNNFDPSEELQYGPGIVSKLRCRYLTLALRQTNGRTKRPLLIDNLRRATSLNNLLDGGGSTGSTIDDQNSCTEDNYCDDDHTNNENNFNYNNKISTYNAINSELIKNHDNNYDEEYLHLNKKSSSILKDEILSNNVATFQNGSNNVVINNCLEKQSGKTVNVQEKNYSDIKRSGRQVKRGNDSLKRARSVEALLCEKSSWLLNQQQQQEEQENAIINDTEKENIITNTTAHNVTNNKQTNAVQQPTIEDKIVNARERITTDTKNYPPKRLTSIIDDTERPPPDLVKQTLRLFESSSNRRGGANVKRNQNSQVAAKVANYKSIISQEKPAITHPKPPPHSPRKTNPSQINKPNTLDLKSKPKILKKSNPTSPISNLTKKFEDLDDGASKTQSPSPTNLLPTPALLRHQQRESTPLKAPDLIPRKHFDDQNSPINLAKQRLRSVDNSRKSSESSETDSVDGEERTKHISKSALENISSAGTTLHFSFNSNNKTDSPKQIGIIRPLIAEPKEDVKVKTSNSSDINKKDGNDLKTNLTSREIEKNLINEKKNELANLEAAAKDSSPISWQQLAKKKTNSTANQSNVNVVEAQNNCMVFNFKDRKEVPDYIENDGLLFKRKRELPKPHESGFVVISDISLETSTDVDDAYAMGPPSPCDVEFENANVIIDGKSSIRYKATKENGLLKVQFNDTLTSTFEYPSESSLLDDSTSSNKPNSGLTNYDDFLPIDSDVQIEEIHIPNAANKQQSQSPKSLGNISLGTGLIGSYTPIKAQIQSNFELGITRLPNGSSTSTSNHNDDNGSVNGNLNQSNDDKIEPDSLQYLKPATEDLTIYSEGTEKSDLLY